MTAKPRVPRRTLELMRSAIDALEVATDPTSQKIAVAPEHREALRLYLQTWVAYPLSQVMEHLEGGPVRD